VQTLGTVSDCIEEFETSAQQYKDVLISNILLLKIYRIDFTAHTHTHTHFTALCPGLVTTKTER